MTFFSDIARSIRASWRKVGEKDIPFFPSYSNRYWRSMFPRRNHTDPKIAIEDISWNAMGTTLDETKSVITLEVTEIRKGSFEVRIDYEHKRKEFVEDFLKEFMARVADATKKMFENSLAIDRISIGCFIPFDDLYGQTADRLAIRLTVNQISHAKINWSNANVRNLYILSQSGDRDIVIDIHPSVLAEIEQSLI